jgi:ABC-type microcin C transport system permease subunit YejE
MQKAADMDTYEKVAYSCLGTVAVLYLATIVAGMIAAFPFGLVGFVLLFGLGVLFVKVLKERLRNKEDDYYSKKIDR